MRYVIIKREYVHELLLVFDTSKQQGENGYVKYFDSSHFTQTVPERIITTFFPDPPFPESFGIKENNSISNDLINKGEVFQKEEGSMSCSYWAEAFMLTMLEMNDKNKEKVFNGTLDRFFKFKVEDRFQKLRKIQFLTLPSSIRQTKSQPSISPNYWREKVKEKAIKSAPSKSIY